MYSHVNDVAFWKGLVVAVVMFGRDLLDLLDLLGWWRKRERWKRRKRKKR